MSYIGRTGKLSQRAYNKVSFLATAGQTIKTGLSYVAGFVEVHVNGLLLTDTVDYTATNGNSVTFVLALNVDDEVTVISLKTFAAADMLQLSGGTVAGDLGVAGGAIVDGTLLVGTTSAYGADGATISSTGFIFSKRTSQVGFGIDRLTTDGDLIELKKDGAIVGRIGTINSDMTIGTGNAGLRFNAPYGELLPHNVSTNLSADSTVSLGSGAVRFNNLYLSGGVYLGGTGADNKLDEYEEGTWTPVIAGSSGGAYTYTAGATARYTKVGNLVTLSAQIQNITTSGTGQIGYVQIRGVPFTKPGDTFATGAVELVSATFYSGTTYAVVSFTSSSTSDRLYIRLLGDSGPADFPVSGVVNGDTDLNFTITYQV